MEDPIPDHVLTFKYKHGQLFFLVLLTHNSVRFFHHPHLYHVAPMQYNTRYVFRYYLSSNQQRVAALRRCNVNQINNHHKIYTLIIIVIIKVSCRMISK